MNATKSKVRRMGPNDEAQRICDALARGMPKQWDGRNSIQELKVAAYHWRQMEWIGWYNEFKANQVVRAALGGDIGPRYGNTAFDYRLHFVWDFKVHSASGRGWTVLNDREAVDRCIADHGGVGFLITLGVAEFNDLTSSFKTWHDRLKGGVSKYERQRVARGVPSRRRKVAFRVTGYRAIYFSGPEAVSRGLRDRWLKAFQEGMRNADGSPRRAKYQVNVAAIPRENVAAEVGV